MALNRRIAVIGSAISAPVTDEAKSLEELLFDVAQAAMRDAGLDADQIDGIVVASNDQFDGRAISIMAASGSVGGVDRDIARALAVARVGRQGAAVDAAGVVDVLEGHLNGLGAGLAVFARRAGQFHHHANSDLAVGGVSDARRAGKQQGGG